MTGKTVLVLGAGSGGLVVANRLRRMLGKQHRIVLVDRNPIHSFAPAFTGVMLGRRTPGRISRDLTALRRKGIEFICSEITRIDPAARTVRLVDQEITAGYLVIALGAQYSSEEIPGLNKAWTYYHLDGADGLNEELRRFRGGRVTVVVSALPYKCPAAPYEGALLLDDHFRRTGLDAEVHVYTPESQPLPVAGKAVGRAVLDILASRKIEFHPGVNLKTVDQQAKAMHFADGTEAPFDLLVATPVHTVPHVVREAGLAPEGGWVSVDRETLAIRSAGSGQATFENVYAIGDVTTIPLANGMLLPKAGVFAHGEAEVVARNIAAEINGSDPIWAFGGQGSCFLETTRSKCAYATGHFFAEPEPEVHLRHPSRRWHWAKTGFERLWLWRWF